MLILIIKSSFSNVAKFFLLYFCAPKTKSTSQAQNFVNFRPKPDQARIWPEKLGQTYKSAFKSEPTPNRKAPQELQLWTDATKKAQFACCFYHDWPGYVAILGLFHFVYNSYVEIRTRGLCKRSGW